VALVELEERPAGVRLLTLNDPERRNALGDEMGAELVAACDAVARDEAARALVVTGAGQAFCAGADLGQLFGAAPDRSVAAMHDRLQVYYRPFLAVRELALPTIAAVNGAAVGAGLNLAMCCDLRLAGPHASFGATFTRIGLHPGGGCTWFLVDALGPSKALKVLLLGEPLRAEVAVREGLAEGPEQDVVEAALALAAQVAEVEPALARQIKEAVGIAARTRDFDATLHYETWAQAASSTSERLNEWVARFQR
jgi:enoyl-CoA hydratase